MTRTDVKSPGPASPSLHAPAVPLPRQLGDWELVDLAGRGSLTEVYRARPIDRGHERPGQYAVKMLRPEWQDDARAVEVLRREAQVGRTVSHPHLVAILAAEVRRPPYRLVMPWLAGRTLAAWGRRRRRDLAGVLWIVRQVAEALDALDTAGWMHGDVKPSNVLVSPEGHATLVDLGFARRPGEVGSIVDRCVVGTCNYIAPEMITSALRPDVRSDVYSLGVVLFEALSGRLPYTADDLAELATQHKQSRPPDLQALAPHVPSEVTRLVHAMLAKEPLRRPQTPAELVERLVELEIATFGERGFD